MELKEILGLKNVNINDEVFKKTVERWLDSFEMHPKVGKELQKYLETGEENFTSFAVNFISKSKRWFKSLYISECDDAGIEAPDFDSEEINKVFNFK